MLNRLEEQISFINNNKLSGCSTMSFIKNTTKIIHKVNNNKSKNCIKL